jgi:hypothetical protein
MHNAYVNPDQKRKDKQLNIYSCGQFHGVCGAPRLTTTPVQCFRLAERYALVLQWENSSSWLWLERFVPSLRHAIGEHVEPRFYLCRNSRRLNAAFVLLLYLEIVG